MAYGIRGWAKIVPYSAEAEAMLRVKDWWLDLPDMHNVKVMQARRQGDEIVAHFSGIDNREAAEALPGFCHLHFPQPFSGIAGRRILLGRSDRTFRFQSSRRRAGNGQGPYRQWGSSCFAGGC